MYQNSKNVVQSMNNIFLDTIFPFGFESRGCLFSPRLSKPRFFLFISNFTVKYKKHIISFHINYGILLKTPFHYVILNLYLMIGVFKISIITFANQKGGVGKTMTVSAVASILHQQGYKILIIDLDAQRNLDMVAGDKGNPLEIHRNDSNTLSALHVLSGHCSIKEAIVNSSIGDLVRASNLLYGWRGNRVISGTRYNAIEDAYLKLGKTPFNGESELSLEEKQQCWGIIGESIFQNGTPSTVNDSRILEESLMSIKDEYDYILIDTNPSLTTLTLNALYACNRVVIPTFPESSAIEAVLELYDTIYDIKKVDPFRDLEIAGVLMTKYSQHRKKSVRHESILREVTEEILNTHLFATKIRDTEKASTYVEACVDVVRLDPNGNTTQDYFKFVEELKLRLSSMGGNTNE